MGAPKLCKPDPGICHRATEGTEVKRAWVGDGAWGGSGRGRRGAGFFATFTAHDSRRGTRGQLYGVTVEVQLADLRKIRRRFEENAPPASRNRRPSSFAKEIQNRMCPASGRKILFCFCIVGLGSEQPKNPCCLRDTMRIWTVG